MKIALLCSGLGHVRRGHEVFATELFRLLRDDLDITLFKGGGESGSQVRVIANIPRNSVLLDHVHVSSSPKWATAIHEQERLRIETGTFAHAALQPLLEGGFDVVHCLEQEVCNFVHANRHVFARVPKVLFSNGGAIPARDLPRCDFVQEHTAHNLRYSAREKGFVIPHGVDIERFRPGLATSFRAQHGIAADAFVALSIGTVCYHHKRMDHVIRELAAVPQAHLVIIGQSNQDTPAIRELGQRLMGGRITFTTLPHEQLPEAYAAADVFVLGSLFETFGIVYIEAMAAGLPVVCTQHPNQRSIVEHGLFVNMAKPGALTAALRDTPRQTLRDLGLRGRAVAEQRYDLRLLKRQYLERYQAIAEAPTQLPRRSLSAQLTSHLRNAIRRSMRLMGGQAH